MTKAFKRGDHVEWNSEAGRVRGVIVKKVISAVRFKGYVHHASRDEPQYIIKSEKTDHVAIHKGQALKHIMAKLEMKPKKTKARRKSKRRFCAVWTKCG
jgi:hypothetical protein